MKTIHKYIFLSALIFLLLFNAQSTAQETRITDSRGTPVPPNLLINISVEFNNTPFKEALNYLSEEGNFHLNYNENIIPGDLRITLSYENIPVVYALQRVIEKADLEFIISKGGQIALVKREPLEAAKQVKKFTVSGHITDKNTGEALYGTNVYVEELQTGGSSNRYGFYSLTIPAGYYKLRYSYVGYKTEEIEISLDRSTTLNLELEEIGILTDTLVVLGDIENYGFGAAAMGTVQLSPSSIKSMPMLLGEQDVLKSLHLLPGVTNSRDGDSGFYVRGGNSDQNLILLDEAPIYNAFHFLGFFSVFNADAIKNATLIKGSAPAKYGGRVSSVLDIQMNEGNQKEFNGTAGIGLIFSRLTMQGPLFNNRGSFLISGRRTYLDLFTMLSGEADVQDARLYFYDLNLKTNYRISANDRLFISGYLGRDGLGFTDAINLIRGNTTATVRWNHLFTDKLFSNTSFIYSNYTFETGVYEDEINGDEVELTSKINDLTLKEDFQYFLSTHSRIDFGASYIYHSFLATDLHVRDIDDDFNITIGKRFAHEGALYVSHEFKPFDMLNINYGLRYSMFSVKGDADVFDNDDAFDDVDFEFNQAEDKFYQGFEPRISATYITSDSTSFKFGYSRNFQYMHMITGATSGTPFDIWRPSTERIKPQIADQFSIGFFKDFENHNYEFSVEIFYKNLYNQIEFREGANAALVNYFESELSFGKGWCYGAEFLVRKKLGRLSGWIGYSISKSEKKFHDINGGRPFPAKYDRTHDFSLVLNYMLSKKWIVSANWVYSSGYNTTIPYGNYSVDGLLMRAYSERNAYRLPAYHRLDIGVSYTNNSGGVWNFSLYNAYGRRNPYAILFRQNSNSPENLEAIRLSMFSFVPSISYTFTF